MTHPGPDEGPLPLERYGWNDHWSAQFDAAASSIGASSSARPGRIVRHDGVAVMVAMEDGTEQLPVRGNLDPPTVGDWVVVHGGAVAAILPRTSLMRRRDPDKDVEQALAANVDVVAVVCGLDRPLRDGRIQRSVMLAWDAGAEPLIVLTKADLFDDAAATAEYVEAANPGVEVVTVDSKGGVGIDRIAELVRGRTVVLVGESGAGKSTLTNALAGAELTATGEVRAGDAKGRHTTTWRELHALPGGTVMIDSPGIRSVGVWADPEALAATFSDVEEIADQCRFTDCEHRTEPGCAVLAAVADGTLAEPRLDAWRALVADAGATDRRTEPQVQRPYGRRFDKEQKVARRRKAAKEDKGRDDDT